MTETVGVVSGCSGQTGRWGTVTSGKDFSLSTTRMMIRWANSTWTSVIFQAAATATEKGCPANEFKFKAKGRVTGNTNGSTASGQKFAFKFCEIATSAHEVYSLSMPSGGKLKL